MHLLSLKNLHRGLKTKQFSVQELCEHFFARIENYNPQLNCFITTNKDQALIQAVTAQKKIDSGSGGYLTGIPIAHKDIFCTKGVKTSCGSKMLDNFIPPYDATVVNRLNEAGTVMLGKTNMDEFAMGSSNEYSYYGPVNNPWNLDTVPGGSSGGSAAAIAAGLTPIATGTDTGGSIRQPAAFCGISGLKPTYGAISRYGMIAFASSLDQGGPMAKSAEDLSLLYDAMAAHDKLDATSHKVKHKPTEPSLENSIKGIKIGLPKEFFQSALSPDIQANLQEVIKTLEALGATFVEISIPSLDYAVACYYIIAPAEASSNLSRYDGIRYGYRAQNAKNLTELYMQSRSEGFGTEVKRRIMLGTYVLSSGYFDAYYLKAQKVRRLIRDDFLNAFKQVDVILSPTTPSPAFKFGEHSKNPVEMYLSDIFTIAVNLAGLPALSMPSGFVKKLPVGTQLIGQHFDEATLLRLAHHYQMQTDFHLQQPPSTGGIS